jgi:hypothetical protein
MTERRDGLVAVDSGLVGQTLVEAVYSRVAERPVPTPPAPAGDALAATTEEFVAGDERRLDLTLRRAGYLARIVEAELFEPARQPAAWLGEELATRLAQAADAATEITALCARLARAEPVGKPSPNDPAAATWRIPGPGGHVRHFVARRSIEEHLQNRDRPIDGDPADLKQAWVYGFLVRACEELLPQHDEPSDGAP